MATSIVININSWPDSIWPDDAKCNYTDYRGEVCGVRKKDHIIGTHFFLGSICWCGKCPGNPHETTGAC
jgi:hypothetical protein